MTKFSNYAKRRIIHYHKQGLKKTQIVKELKNDNIFTTRKAVIFNLKKYELHNTYKNFKSSGRLSKLSPEIKSVSWLIKI